MEITDVQSIGLSPNIIQILLALLIVGLAYVAATLSTLVLSALSDRFPARRLFFKRLQPIFQIGPYAVAAYIVIKLLGPDETSLYAILGSMALAIGLAAQDLLKDILGGLVVLIDKPYQIGDRIRASDYYGEVATIGLRSTKLVTPDDSLITIPNSQILGAAISNTNAGAVDCLVTTHIYIPPQVDLARIETIAREAVLTSKAVYLSKPIVVLVTDTFRETKNMTDIEIRAYVFEMRYEEMFVADLTRRIKKALFDQGLLSETMLVERVEKLVHEGLTGEELRERMRLTVAENMVDLGMRFAKDRSTKDRNGQATATR